MSYLHHYFNTSKQVQKRSPLCKELQEVSRRKYSHTTTATMALVVSLVKPLIRDHNLSRPRRQGCSSSSPNSIMIMLPVSSTLWEKKVLKCGFFRCTLILDNYLHLNSSFNNQTIENHLLIPQMTKRPEVQRTQRLNGQKSRSPDVQVSKCPNVLMS